MTATSCCCAILVRAVFLSGNAPCADVTVLDSHPLTSLPQRTQEQIRTAVKPAVGAIVRDPGMGLQDTKVDEIALNAFPVAKDSDSELYAVSWDDRSFGVNEPVWLVELKLNGARNLVHETPRLLYSGHSESQCCLLVKRAILR